MKAAGGRADRAGKTAADFPADKVEAGARVEAEHTPDKELQQDIASDHLAEDKDYYVKLKRMESGACDVKKGGAIVPETEGSAPEKEAQNSSAAKQKSLEKGAPVGRQSEHSGFKQFTPTAFAKDRSEKKGAPKPQKAAPVPATPKAAPAPEVKEEAVKPVAKPEKMAIPPAKIAEVAKPAKPQEAVKPAETEEQQQGGGEEAQQKCMMSAQKSFAGLSAMEQYLAKALPKAGAEVSDEKSEAPEAGETEPKEVEAEEGKGEETEEKCMAAKKSLTGLADLSEFLEKSYGGQTVLDADMYKGVYESEGDDDDDDEDDEDEAEASGALPPDAEAKVRKFLADNPNPPDSKFHEFAEELGVDTAKLEAVAYKIATSAVKKSGLQGLDAMEEYLAKGVGGYKYIKREGGPGNYRYTYADTGKGKPTQGAAPQAEAAKPAEGAEWHAAQRGEHREAGDAAHKQWKELSGKTDTVSQLGAQLAAKKAQYHHAMESHHMAMQFHHEGGAEGGKLAAEHKKYADEHKAAADKHLADMKSHQALYDAEKEGPQKEKPAEKPGEKPTVNGTRKIRAQNETEHLRLFYRYADNPNLPVMGVHGTRAEVDKRTKALAGILPDGYKIIADDGAEVGEAARNHLPRWYGKVSSEKPAEKPAEKPGETVAAPKVAKGAGKGTIKVPRSDKDEPDEVAVKHRAGQYAVHRGVGSPGAELKGWTLTHVPSGLSVKRFAKLSDAKGMADHLHKEVPTAFSNAKLGQKPTDPDMTPEAIAQVKAEVKKIAESMVSYKALPKVPKKNLISTDLKTMGEGELVSKLDQYVEKLEANKHPQAANYRGFAVRHPDSKFYRKPGAGQPQGIPSRKELEGMVGMLRGEVRGATAAAAVTEAKAAKETEKPAAAPKHALPEEEGDTITVKDPNSSRHLMVKNTTTAEGAPRYTVTQMEAGGKVGGVLSGLNAKDVHDQIQNYVGGGGAVAGEGKTAKPKTAEEHQTAIAKQTLKMPDAMAGVMGGPSKAEAAAHLAGKGKAFPHMTMTELKTKDPSLFASAKKVFADNKNDSKKTIVYNSKHNEISALDPGEFAVEQAHTPAGELYVVKEGETGEATPTAGKGTSSDAEHLAAMKELGVKWPRGKAIPTYPAGMTQEQKDQADKHYDAISGEFSADYAKKSMNGLDALKEFTMQKAMDEGTVAKDLPGGESKIDQGHGTTSPNGEEIDGDGYKASGAHKPTPGDGVDGNGQLTGVDKPDDEILSDDEKTSKLVDSIAAKSLDGIRNMRLPGNQREAMGRENAIARQRLQKSEPDVRVQGIPHPLSNQQLHGNTDARTAELVKSDGFYTGGSPTKAAPANMMSTGVLCKSCGCSHSAMLTSCPDCGDGAVRHQTMPGMPVGQTLRPVHRDADVYLPGPSPVVTRR